MNKITQKYSVKSVTLVDTGAAISVVHENFISKIVSISKIIKNLPFYNASGEKMGTNKFATFSVQIANTDKIFKIVNALVVNEKSVASSSI